MPIKLPNGLPARAVLESENVFVMDDSRAYHQDIRPLKVVILNLMPIKETTETQLLRLLGNTPLQIEITLLRMESHESKNTSSDHLATFYSTFQEVRRHKFDGMIITGAPIEHLPFEEVTYWAELQEVLDWTKTHVTSTFHICWGAQAALYHHYGIPKHPLTNKIFGIYPHTLLEEIPLVRGFDEQFMAPHSRHTEIRREELQNHKDLLIVSESKEAGVYLVVSRDSRQIFVTGHSEYERGTLHQEYLRDINRGLNIRVPANYFPNDDPTRSPSHLWKSHAYLLYSNWLNYYVYQETPYDLDKIGN